MEYTFVKKFLSLVLVISIFVGLFFGLKYLKDNGYLDNLFVSKGETASTGSINPGDKTTKKTTKKNETTTTVSYPSEWEMLFDYDNFTVKSTMYFMGVNENTYKRVDSKYYIYIKETNSFDETTNVTFDFKRYYDSFTFNSENNTYTATNIYTDTSDWVSDVVIRVVDDRITSISVDQHMASLHIDTLYEFSNYGTTTLE